VALAGTVLALVLTNDENHSGTKVVSAVTTTTPIGATGITGITTGTLPETLTITPPTTTGLIQTLTTTTTPTVTTPTTTPVTTPNGVINWPNRSGYTIVLESDPTGNGRTKPDATAQRALNAGLPQVGILDSSGYSSLNPGYYVVFTGVYDSTSAAQSHLGAARSAGFPLAYIRQVRR